MTTTNTILQDLIDHKIVQLKINDTFTFASGIKSPIYTDLRQTISYPETRKNITLALAKLIQDQYPNATVIAGVATAGIPQAALVAAELNLPMVYVRSKPKDHGTGRQVEGVLHPDDQVVLIDDLISTGGSVIAAAEAVVKEGFQVAGVVSIFSYGFPDANQNFTKAGFDFAPLLTYSGLITLLAEQKVISDDDHQRLSKWHQDPWAWPLQ
ncbi:orotate phosphoribosyltransferase [Fructobacillus pseudoficulneus]|uniref:Orotate phosphoribosyltransferase n=1 Tax=Fructobacillus pseudoficulneus TaxID=220714 RepID=A0A3F3GYA8_9LACO|nr:orotate phosphoribosyltransferase [Fructobacillus pseudoficulneus]GAP03067.1 orotate phosphoribosyltransferase [Fructobacillus pseudoficulneus]SEH41647.1 orotate phosphoribosyltransferase [Fructobacillus pseudoficulneus]